MRTADSHCHLVSERLANQADTLVAEAREVGVARILNVGCDWESSFLAIEQAERYPDVFASVGIQPHDASSYTPEKAEALAARARQGGKVVAIGEIGLDGHYELSPMPQQIACFEHFVSLAREAKLPILVHMRETFADLYAGLQRNPGVKGVIHCFTGTLDEARAFLDLGLYISFSGIVTFKDPSEFQDVVRFVPRDRILVETDSPYLAPKPFRGKMNRPAFVVHTCERIAKMRNEEVESFAEATFANTLSLFPGMANPS